MKKKYAENIAGNLFSCLFYNDPVLDYAAFTVHVSWFIIGEILWRTAAIMLQVEFDFSWKISFSISFVF